VHPLHTLRYLTEVLLPAIEQGAVHAGRTRGEVEITVSPFVVTGPDEDLFVRSQIAFYASTPSYRPVMALHGWEQVAERLSGHASRGEWGEMPALIGDEMLATFAVVAPVEELAAALSERYTGLADRLMPYIPFQPGDRETLWRALLKR
jgi:alkanesulfonate monooxygenase SsuD/methylene tetrahydromethanopterin reductase-like flavin-dependent oxidoreductase (luciferase family)